MIDKEQIVFFLKQAIDANQKGKELFQNDDYTVIPDENRTKIEKYCIECASCFKKLREELDTNYKDVYFTFYNGGLETDCRIAKNRWCFGLIEFAKARLKDLENS